MGVPLQDCIEFGNLLGTKISINEFVAYVHLGDLIKNGGMSERAVTIATYALCGFANFSSIAIQIGGIGGIAPERRGDLAKLGLRAMFGGALASWMTATVAGMLIG
jgi:CNT family concentrative nucleoside transporter